MIHFTSIGENRFLFYSITHGERTGTVAATSARPCAFSHPCARLTADSAPPAGWKLQGLHSCDGPFLHSTADLRPACHGAPSLWYFLVFFDPHRVSEPSRHAGANRESAIKTRGFRVG